MGNGSGEALSSPIHQACHRKPSDEFQLRKSFLVLNTKIKALESVDYWLKAQFLLCVCLLSLILVLNLTPPASVTVSKLLRWTSTALFIEQDEVG